jgi:dipeptidase
MTPSSFKRLGKRTSVALLAAACILAALGTAAFGTAGGGQGLRTAAAPPPEFESCTSVFAGRLATADGSTMTSHSCDSGTDRTWITIVPHAKHAAGSMEKVYFEPKRTKGPNDTDRIETGEIPYPAETYAFMNAAYPIMNEYQLAIGETTIGGRFELKTDNGIIDAPELYRLLLERAKTAREAIKIADELTKAYGYNDYGESFTFADPREVWLFEIYGPGKGRKGAVWAAQRIPDDEISVSANASRLRKLDLKNTKDCLASANVLSLATEMGFWNPKSGAEFEFCYAYAPSSRTSLGCRRREWRVLSLLAPSLRLNGESENYPLSVKPEKKVTVADLLAIFRDAYADTAYDMTNGLNAVNRKGETVRSPVAGPFLNNDLKTLLRVKPERTICSPAATYLQVTQSRAGLPDPIGGVVWLGYDNPATTPHTPFYCGIAKMPDSYTIDGRWGYKSDCAWWAFRTVSKLANIRWQDMSKDIEKVWRAIEDQAFGAQKKIEDEALALFKQDPEKACRFLTDYSLKTAEKSVEDYRKLTQDLWTKYNYQF